jgi:hypothetical protein
MNNSQVVRLSVGKNGAWLPAAKRASGQWRVLVPTRSWPGRVIDLQSRIRVKVSSAPSWIGASRKSFAVHCASLIGAMLHATFAVTF